MSCSGRDGKAHVTEVVNGQVQCLYCDVPLRFGGPYHDPEGKGRIPIHGPFCPMGGPHIPKPGPGYVCEKCGPLALQPRSNGSCPSCWVEQSETHLPGCQLSPWGPPTGPEHISTVLTRVLVAAKVRGLGKPQEE